MPAERHQVMVQVTDEDGNVESEPLYIALQGAIVVLEFAGVEGVCFADELRDVFAPRQGVQAA